MDFGAPMEEARGKAHKPGGAIPRPLPHLWSGTPSPRLLGKLRNGTPFGVSQWRRPLIPKHGDNLGFDLFPFLGAGGSAQYTHTYAPSPPLTQLSPTLNDNKLLGLGRSALSNSLYRPFRTTRTFE